MRGVGREAIGPPASITMDFSGRQTQFYLFRFRRGDSDALELWSVWRNGDVVPLDYQPDQVLGAAAARQSCVSKANAVPPPKSLRASSAEIMITHRTPSKRSQF
jgi:hypothetical protein